MFRDAELEGGCGLGFLHLDLFYPIPYLGGCFDFLGSYGMSCSERMLHSIERFDAAT